MINDRLLSKIHIILFFLLLTECSPKYTSFKKGFIITPDNTKFSGFVKIDSCEGSIVRFKKTLNDSTKQLIFSDIKTVVTENDSFVVLRKKTVKDISIRYYNYKNDIIVKVIENGKLNLYKHCITDYQSSMFRTEKYVLHGYIICKKGTEKIYWIPSEPGKFLRVAKMFFSDDLALMAEINRTKFVKEIVHDETGEIHTYKTVSAEHILNYVKKYNQRAITLNK
jgi:hypothetical protein